MSEPKPDDAGGPAGYTTQLSRYSELASIAAARAALDNRERIAIGNARILGVTWTQIATALGLHHRQGAQQRYQRLQQGHQGRKVSDPVAPAPLANDTAERALDAAAWVRSQLVGDGPYGRSEVLRHVDRILHDLRRRLDALQRTGEITDRRNRNRQALDQQLITGWEPSVIDCAARLRNVAGQINDLARMHAQAVADHKSANRRTRPTE
jgi:hypothetical protein